MLSVPANVPPGRQDPGDLGEHLILEPRVGNVVEHREADDPGEGAVRERQRGRVALDDVDAVAEVTPEPLAVLRLELEHGQTRNPVDEQSRRLPEPGPDLEHVVTELNR